jgi:hypothetical protein
MPAIRNLSGSLIRAWLLLLIGCILVLSACGGGGGGGTDSEQSSGIASQLNSTSGSTPGSDTASAGSSGSESASGSIQSSETGSAMTSGSGTGSGSESAACDPVSITSTPSRLATKGQAYVYEPVATGTQSYTWSLLSGPAGMMIDAISGKVAWTPLALGLFNAEIKVSNDCGEEDTQAWSVEVSEPGQAPLILEENLVKTALKGEVYRQEIQASGTKPFTWALAGDHPQGMTGERQPNDTYILTWTPAENQVGSNNVVVSVSNEFGSDTLEYQIEVDGQVLKFTSEPPTTVEVNRPYVYQPTVSGTAPFRYALVQGPSEMTIDASSGLINWTPDAEKTVPIEIEVSNAFGRVTQAYSLMVVAFAPEISAVAPQNAIVGYDFQLELKASGTQPISWELLEAPQDMLIDAASGHISWKPAPIYEGEEVVVWAKATNVKSSAEVSFSIKVLPPNAAIVTVPTSNQLIAFPRELFSLTLEAIGAPPIEWSLKNPTGDMQIVPADDGHVAEFNWTPLDSDEGKKIRVTVQAWNEFNVNSPATLELAISVFGITPNIISIQTLTASLNQEFTYQPRLAAGKPPLTWSIREGPDGLSIDPTTGRLAWTPSSLGMFDVTIRAENSSGHDDEPFTISVVEVPRITSTPLTVAVIGGQYQYTPIVSGSQPITLSLKEAPSGMTIIADRIVWTPGSSQLGDFRVIIEAKNSVGVDTQDFLINVVSTFQVSQAKSEFYLSADCLAHNGFAFVEAKVIPHDERGAYLPAGLPVTIKNGGNGGTWIDANGKTVAEGSNVFDHGDGTYSAYLRAATSEFNAVLAAEIMDNGSSVKLSSRSLPSAQPAPALGGFGGCPVSDQVTITVIAEGDPFEEAFVMIGDALNTPFANNVAWTDENGQAIIRSQYLKPPYNITVGAEGYRLVTVNGLAVSDVVLVLNDLKSTLADYVTVKGNMLNYSKPATGNLYGGFVLENQTFEKIMSFNFVDILEDFYNVNFYGNEMSLPGNVVLSPQSLISSGADYTMMVEYRPKNIPSDFMVVSGEIKIIDLLDLYSNYTDFPTYIAGVLNILIPRKAGVLKNVEVNRDRVDQDVPLSHELKSGLQFQVANLPDEDLSLVAFPLRYSDTAQKYYGTGIATFAAKEDAVTVTTINSDGVFSGLNLGGIVSMTDLSGYSSKNSVIFKRNIASMTAHVLFDDFMVPLSKLAHEQYHFTFEYTENPKKPAPLPDLVVTQVNKYANLKDPNTGETISLVYGLWDVYSSGESTDVILPVIPDPSLLPGKKVPQGLSKGSSYYWEPRVFSLSLKQDFDFQFLDLNTWKQYASHSASNTQSFYAY